MSQTEQHAELWKQRKQVRFLTIINTAAVYNFWRL